VLTPSELINTAQTNNADANADMTISRQFEDFTDKLRISVLRILQHLFIHYATSFNARRRHLNSSVRLLRRFACDGNAGTEHNFYSIAFVTMFLTYVRNFVYLTSFDNLFVNYYSHVYLLAILTL